MSWDSIKKINLLRNFYQADVQKSGSSSELLRELQDIKSELKISNDLASSNESSPTTATQSPYLPDQTFYSKSIVFNSEEESSWRNVKSFDQVQKENEINYSESNKRKLNII